MHTVVERPSTSSCEDGRISCCPVGQEPIVFRWTGPEGRSVRVDASGSEAIGVGVGQYRVVATDAYGDVADVVVDVRPLSATAMVVREYKVTHTSTVHSRDGTVEAVGSGMEHVERFLWTHGAETRAPVLRDVPCGTYAVVPLDASVTMVHQCAPGRVVVKPWEGEYPRSDGR